MRMLVNKIKDLWFQPGSEAKQDNKTAQAKANPPASTHKVFFSPPTFRVDNYFNHMDILHYVGCNSMGLNGTLARKYLISDTNFFHC